MFSDRVNRRKRKIVDAETFYGDEYPNIYKPSQPEGNK